MKQIWSKKSRLWKFAAVYLAVFELIFFLTLFFGYNVIGRSFLIHSGEQSDFLEYSQWYDTVYRPEHPNAARTVSDADMLQIFTFWSMIPLGSALIQQEYRQRSAWKKGLLEAGLFAVLLVGWNFFFLPRLTHYRLFHGLMPAQAAAIPLLLQLITHPDLPREGESG